MLATSADVTVVTPRIPGPYEDGGLAVRRVGYLPRRWESVADGAILPNIKARPSRIVQLPFLLGAMTLATLSTSRRIKPDVVHAHWIVPSGLLARLTGRRYVVTVHGADAYALRGPIARRLKHWVIKRAAVVLPVSDDIEARLGLQELDVRHDVIPMGVDLDVFSAIDRKPEMGRLLFVGRLATKKGVDVLLRALAAVEGVTLRIAGDGPEQSELERLTEQLGIGDRVSFLGRCPRPDVVIELSRCAAIVVPSVVAADGDTDGTPVVLGEAAAAGVPIIASDLAGIGEHIEHGVTGVLVRPGSVDELAAAIDTVDDLEPLGKEARRSLAPRFDIHAVGARYAQHLGVA